MAELELITPEGILEALESWGLYLEHNATGPGRITVNEGWGHTPEHYLAHGLNEYLNRRLCAMSTHEILMWKASQTV